MYVFCSESCMCLNTYETVYVETHQIVTHITLQRVVYLLLVQLSMTEEIDVIKLDCVLKNFQQMMHGSLWELL